MTAHLVRFQTELTARMFGGLVDLVAVERAANGVRPMPALSSAEERAVVRRLIEDGHGASMVARRLGVSGKTARCLVAEVRPTAGFSGRV